MCKNFNEINEIDTLGVIPLLYGNYEKKQEIISKIRIALVKYRKKRNTKWAQKKAQNDTFNI